MGSAFQMSSELLARCAYPPSPLVRLLATEPPSDQTRDKENYKLHHAYPLGGLTEHAIDSGLPDTAETVEQGFGTASVPDHVRQHDTSDDENEKVDDLSAHL